MFRKMNEYLKKLVEFKDEYFAKLLILFSNNTKVVEILLKSGINSDAEFNHRTPLVNAVLKCRKEEGMNASNKKARIRHIKLLLAHGAKVNQEIANAYWDKYESRTGTPLYFACYVGDLEIINSLVNYGADVNYVVGKSSWKEDTALMVACRKRRLDIVKFLVEHGADVNYTTAYWGCSPLSSTTSYDMRKYLICNGAKFDYEDIRLLFENMYQLEPKMMCTIYRGNVSELSKLIEKYLQEMGSVEDTAYNSKLTEALKFADILDTYVLSKLDRMHFNLKEELLGRENLNDTGYNVDVDTLNFYEYTLRNICDIKNQLCKFIYTVDKRLKEKNTRSGHDERKLKHQRIESVKMDSAEKKMLQGSIDIILG